MSGEPTAPTLFDEVVTPGGRAWPRADARDVIAAALGRCGVPESRSLVCADAVIRSLVEAAHFQEVDCSCGHLDGGAG